MNTNKSVAAVINPMMCAHPTCAAQFSVKAQAFFWLDPKRRH